MNEREADKVIDLGELILKFARVDRITYFEDGKTPESDTDHTVMLSIIGCAVASTFRKDLDLGLVAQFGLVHDLVEAYAGDTPSLGGILTETEKKEKEERERRALQRIENEFGQVFPWLSETIERYERLDTEEALFIKTLDKVMPKITHVLNKAALLKSRGYTKETTDALLEEQGNNMEKGYGKGEKEVMDLFRILSKKIGETF